MKTLLLTHRFYWPDTAPYGLILKELAGELSEILDVQIFTTVPSYRRTAEKNQAIFDDQQKVKRIGTLNESIFGTFGRVLNTLWYSFRLFLHIVRLRPAVVAASTFPPVLAALSAALACKLTKSRFIYILMDVYPEVAYLDQKRGVIFRCLMALDNISLKLAYHVVVLSSDMQQSLISRGIPDNTIRTIPNFELGKESPTEKMPYIPTYDTQRLTIAFCGNIGNFQGLDSFKTVVQSLCNSGVARFVFLGEGKMKSALEQFFKANAVEHVHFINQMPVSAARALMASADLNLVSLSPGVSACSFPSKTSTICSVSGPLLVYDNPQSQLCRLVTEHGAGITGGYSDHVDIIQQVTDLHKNRHNLLYFRAGSASLYNAHFNRSGIAFAWRNLFKEAMRFSLTTTDNTTP